jgi:hypothetical protein
MPNAPIRSSDEKKDERFGLGGAAEAAVKVLGESRYDARRSFDGRSTKVGSGHPQRDPAGGKRKAAKLDNSLRST